MSLSGGANDFLIDYDYIRAWKVFVLPLEVSPQLIHVTTYILTLASQQVLVVAP